MSRLGLYFHTGRHLKLSQVAARVLARLPRRRPGLGPSPGRRSQSGQFVQSIALRPSLQSPQRFRFLDVEVDVLGARGWQDATTSLLWMYNLHYFDDLNAAGAESRRGWHDVLLRRWVAENPPGEGIGWQPYPLSRRLVNWVKLAVSGHALPTECEASLAIQARSLMRSLEFHLLGNHLLANAKALLFAGMYFQGREAEGWARRGRAILQKQLREQVLDDGGHFELSPMYHAIVVEDLLDLVNLAAAFGADCPPPLPDLLGSMRRWLHVMQHPDGEIAFFNDAAFAIAGRPADLEAYALRLRLAQLRPDSAALVVLADSGYVRAQAGPAHLLCDCADVGPDYLPGHAHADTLSFELSVHGRRVFVNSGTSRYGVDAERQRQRGTLAHNTVTIDGADSSEVWAGFRVARRARAMLEVATASGDIAIQASHDGYRRLAGRNLHRRRWLLNADSLHIHDTVEGEFSSAVASFHLHPDVQIVALDANTAMLHDSGGHRLRVAFEGEVTLSAQATTWHPEFGVTVPNQVLLASFRGAGLVTRVHWLAPA